MLKSINVYTSRSIDGKKKKVISDYWNSLFFKEFEARQFRLKGSPTDDKLQIINSKLKVKKGIVVKDMMRKNRETVEYFKVSSYNKILISYNSFNFRFD